MHIAPHWSRVTVDEQGRPDPQGDIVGVGWSDRSEADAEQHALTRAQGIAQALLEGHDPPREDYYTDRPLREPIVETLGDADDPDAVITRNIYGSYVLNAARVMFIDMDRPQPKPVGALARLFGKRPEPVVDDTPQRARDVARRHGLSLRLYETAAGYRGIITDRPFDPDSAQTRQLLHDFDADRLYVRLCQAQSCFRARLFPKPWRLGLSLPPRGYPWPDDKTRQRFDDWTKQYDTASQGHATCKPLQDEPRTPSHVHHDVAPILTYHDELACPGELPLA
jgi:hypothetical protein